MPAEILDSRVVYRFRPQQEETGVPPTGPPAGMQGQQSMQDIQDFPQLTRIPFGGPMGGQQTRYGLLQGRRSSSSSSSPLHKAIPLPKTVFLGPEPHQDWLLKMLHKIPML